MSAPEPSLRPAAPEDEAFLDRLYASTREREMAAWPWPDGMKRDFLRMQAHAQRTDYGRRFPEARVEIILVGGAPAGRLAVDRSGGEIDLLDISLLPEHRGQGIGGRLLEGLLAEAARDGRRVRLQVERANPARRLYERLGFVPRGDDGVYCAMEWSSTGRPAAGRP